MNGVHDMGGMHGFGPVPADDARFHADWERLVFGLVRVTRAEGVYNVDESRYGIERMDPAAYLAATYFERWLSSLERNLVDAGVLSPEEVETGYERGRELADPGGLVPDHDDPELAARIRASFREPAAFDRPGENPRFDVGDPVRVRTFHPEGHTRCPRYVRGHAGEVDAVHGNHVLPDARANGVEHAEPLYTVSFTASELWGPDAERPDDAMAVDLWEPYLEAAGDNDE